MVQQIRITIPKWIAKVKGWKEGSNLQLVPLVDDDNRPITKKTPLTIKEVK